MVKIILSHKVKDYDTWRPYFDEDMSRRQSAGITNEQVYRDAADQNYIYVSGDIEDPSSLNGFFDDPALKATMEKAGVISEPSMWVMKPA